MVFAGVEGAEAGAAVGFGMGVLAESEGFGSDGLGAEGFGVPGSFLEGAAGSASRRRRRNNEVIATGIEDPV
jgi:hypothetical protein